MAVNVLIPTPMRRFTNSEETVTVAAGNIKEMVVELIERFPGIKKPMIDETGELRKFVNIYVNGEDIRFKQGNDTPLNDGDEVSIVPAIAGGC